MEPETSGAPGSVAVVSRVHLSGVFPFTYFCGDIQNRVKEMEVGKEENKSGKEKIGLTVAVGKPERRKRKV